MKIAWTLFSLLLAFVLVPTTTLHAEDVSSQHKLESLVEGKLRNLLGSKAFWVEYDATWQERVEKVSLPGFPVHHEVVRVPNFEEDLLALSIRVHLPTDSLIEEAEVSQILTPLFGRRASSFVKVSIRKDLKQEPGLQDTILSTADRLVDHLTAKIPKEQWVSKLRNGAVIGGILLALWFWMFAFYGVKVRSNGTPQGAVSEQGASLQPMSRPDVRSQPSVASEVRFDYQRFVSSVRPAVERMDAENVGVIVDMLAKTGAARTASQLWLCLPEQWKSKNIIDRKVSMVISNYISTSISSRNDDLFTKSDADALVEQVILFECNQSEFLVARIRSWLKQLNDHDVNQLSSSQLNLLAGYLDPNQASYLIQKGSLSIEQFKDALESSSNPANMEKCAEIIREFSSQPTQSEADVHQGKVNQVIWQLPAEAEAVAAAKLGVLTAAQLIGRYPTEANQLMATFTVGELNQLLGCLDADTRDQILSMLPEIKRERVRALGFRQSLEGQTIKANLCLSLHKAQAVSMRQNLEDDHGNAA